MDKSAFGAVARMFAREMLKWEDTISGMSMVRGFGTVNRKEMIDIGREALDLIEKGDVW